MKIRLIAVLLTLALLLSACEAPVVLSSEESSSAPITASEASENESVVSSVYSAILEEETAGEFILVGLEADSTVLSGRSILLDKSSELRRDLDGDSVEEYFKIGLDSPNGLRVLAASENRGFNLADSFTLKAAFDEMGDIREDYYIQLTFLDFDADGDDDVLLSVGNLTDLSETLFLAFTDSAFELKGAVPSGAKLRYDGETFTASDGLAYVYTTSLQLVGEEGLEEVPVELTDEALARRIETLIAPLVITLPDDFTAPSQIPATTLMMSAMFGYILQTDPSIRQYTETELLVSSADVLAQLDLLFGDAATLTPSDFVKKSDEDMVYYEPDSDTFRMPLAGYYTDLVRIDQLEHTETGYIATVAFIENDYETSYDTLEGLEPVRTVRYTIGEYDNRLVVTGLETLG